MRAEIERYYDETWFDYRVLWLNRRNLAFHFGYRDEAETRHRDCLENTNRELAALAGIGPGSRVLDAGCGVGGTAFSVARGCGASCVGITLARRQAVRAVDLAAGFRLDRRTGFLQADYTAAPFRGGSFDAVLAIESLCHAADKRAFYREAHRVLRPGGRLVVAEYMRARRPLDAAAERQLRQWLAGWVIPDLDTSEEHLRHAAAVGFTAATVDDFTERAAASLRRLHRIAYYTYPLAAAARLLGMRSATQHGNVRAAIGQYDSLCAGQWRYAVLAATRP
jgi:tocopherol O-methyltransferase